MQELGTMALRLGESLCFRKPWGLAVNVDSDARDGLRHVLFGEKLRWPKENVSALVEVNEVLQQCYCSIS